MHCCCCCCTTRGVCERRYLCDLARLIGWSLGLCLLLHALCVGVRFVSFSAFQSQGETVGSAPPQMPSLPQPPPSTERAIGLHRRGHASFTCLALGFGVMMICATVARCGAFATRGSPCDVPGLIWRLGLCVFLYALCVRSNICIAFFLLLFFCRKAVVGNVSPETR